jgi:hypothetical protein
VIELHTTSSIQPRSPLTYTNVAIPAVQYESIMTTGVGCPDVDEVALPRALTYASISLAIAVDEMSPQPRHCRHQGCDFSNAPRVVGRVSSGPIDPIYLPLVHQLHPALASAIQLS